MIIDSSGKNERFTFLQFKKLGFWKLKYHNFRRKNQRLAIYLNKKLMLSHSEQKGVYESSAIGICRKIIRMDDTEVVMTPRTNKRIARNKRLKIDIILKNGHVDIYVNKHPEINDISDKGYNYLIGIFDDEIEKDREIMEKEITDDVINGLKTIYNTIKNEEI